MTPGTVSDYLPVKGNVFTPLNVKCPKRLSKHFFSCVMDNDWRRRQGIKKLSYVRIILAYRATDKKKKDESAFTGYGAMCFESSMKGNEGKPYFKTSLNLVSAAEFTRQPISKMRRDSCGNLARTDPTI